MRKQSIDSMKKRLASVKARGNLPGDTRIIDDAITNSPDLGLKVINKGGNRFLIDVVK